MSLPPGFLDELRIRVSLSSVVGRKVTWDMRKSNPGRGDMWAPCPFHQEKSASFHVDDRKGFYYCFGCHAKGDALGFLRATENLGFIEAVEVLAREAGMAMPDRDPQAAQKSDRRAQLGQVMEEAVKWFRLQLRTNAAADARAYLSRRSLSPEAQDRWEIGFAPDQRSVLFQALTQKGIAAELILASGLCARADDGSIYDRFRGRIIFPIRDGRGRAISLGGRALDQNARAKYLNGPETELFDKGRSLYNHATAREAAGKGQPLILAEGYMDVIALAEAGFRATVAPLGTAITEDQLRLMWRISDEPIIALDGDTAGRRAAQRVIDLALPLLKAGKGLRFAMMPAAMDPDDLIRAQGVPAMQAVLDNALPMVRLLWQRETDGRAYDTPEGQAALDARLAAVTARISDKLIQKRYNEILFQLKRSLFWSQTSLPSRKKGTRTGFGGEPAPPMATTRASLLAQASGPVEQTLREALILGALILHPVLIEKFAPDLERLEFTGPDHNRLFGLLMAHHDAGDCMARIAQSAPDILDSLMSQPHLRNDPTIRQPGDLLRAETCVRDALAVLHAIRGHGREVEDASIEVEGLSTESLTFRVAKATSARHAAVRPGNATSTSLEEDRPKLIAQLNKVMESLESKKNR